MGSKIWLKKDAAFKLFQPVDIYRGRAKGQWQSSGNKILFTPAPVYDTVSLLRENGVKKDSLILSKRGRARQFEAIKIYSFLVENSARFSRDRYFQIQNLRRSDGLSATRP